MKTVVALPGQGIAVEVVDASTKQMAGPVRAAYRNA